MLLLNHSLKVAVCLGLLVVGTTAVFAQEDATMKPSTKLDDKKKDKKAAKAEAKIHEKSKKDMDKQISQYHKKKYKKDFKYKAPNNASKKEEKGL